MSTTKQANNCVLDPLFFKLLEQRETDTHIHQAYRVLQSQSTIVLFAADDKTPIAAVTMLADIGATTTEKEKTKAQSIATLLSRRQTSDGGKDFTTVQALCNTEGARIHFALHNLTHFGSPDATGNSESSQNVAYIKIDLLTKDIAVQKVDLPTLSINRVNEVRPSESVVVSCDQRTQREMIIRSRKASNVSSSNSSSSSSSRDDNKVSFEAARGTRIHVNVVASKKFPEMVTLLGNSRWRDADVIYRRIVKTRALSTRDFEPQSCGDVFAAHLTRNLSVTGMQSTAVLSDESALLNDLQNVRGPGSQRKINAILKREAKRLKLLERRNKNAERRLREKKKKEATAERTSLVIPTTDQTAQIVLGDVVDKPSAFYTDHGYDFDASACPMWLDVSVWSKLPRLAAMTDAEAREQAVLHFKDIEVETARKQLEAVVIYKVEKCVICMENESNIVYLQCGHQCECSDCSPLMESRACPTCRRPIKARVNVSDLPEFTGNAKTP